MGRGTKRRMKRRSGLRSGMTAGDMKGIGRAERTACLLLRGDREFLVCVDPSDWNPRKARPVTVDARRCVVDWTLGPVVHIPEMKQEFWGGWVPFCRMWAGGGALSYCRHGLKTGINAAGLNRLARQEHVVNALLKGYWELVASDGAVMKFEPKSAAIDDALGIVVRARDERGMARLVALGDIDARVPVWTAGGVVKGEPK